MWPAFPGRADFAGLSSGVGLEISLEISGGYSQASPDCGDGYSLPLQMDCGLVILGWVMSLWAQGWAKTVTRTALQGSPVRETK